MIANRDVRAEAFSTGVRLWQVAQELGVTDSTFSRWLRREMTEERKAEVLRAIKRLAEGRAER